MIVGIIGRSVDPYGNMCSMGTGKDKATDVLVEHGFVKIAMADECKRFCAKIYGFSVDQLWGPSEERNKPDIRLPREVHAPFVDGNCECCGSNDESSQCYLTPRYALQQIASTWGRNCYKDVWASYTMNIAKQLINGIDRPRKRIWFNTTLQEEITEDQYFEKAYPKYNQVQGLTDAIFISEEYRTKNVIISDCRFSNECLAVKQNGGKIVLIIRRIDHLPDGPNLQHESEKDLNKYQVGDSDAPWDYVVENDGTLEDLKLNIAKTLGII
jgi:hypothetical protein